MAALLAYGPKYASILAGTPLDFDAPKDVSQLVVVERLPGNATTDFGAISVAPTVDHERSCDAAEVERFETILRAGWRAFDEEVRSARGKTLATGPRGGGRSLEKIVAHVIGADAGYLAAVGWKAPKAAEPAEQPQATRAAILAALRASASVDSAPRPARRHPLVGTVLRPAGGVACHGARMGDRAARRDAELAMSGRADCRCIAPSLEWMPPQGDRLQAAEAGFPQEAERMTVTDFVRRYERALAAQDWALVDPLVHDDASVTFSNGSVHKGKDAVRAAFEQNFSTIVGEKYQITNIHWLLQSDAAAVFLFDFHWSGKIGGRDAAGAGRGTQVMVRNGDGWKLLAEHLGPAP